MSIPSTPLPTDGLLQSIDVGVAAIDEMSSVRHLHALSARRLAAGMLSEAETAAFAEHIYSEQYSARLADVVLGHRLHAARLMGELVATAGWLPANDAGSTARLMGVFVSPLYARRGLARRLVLEAEAQARQAGFRSFTIRAPLGAAGFFERLEYGVASHGVWPLSRDTALPVAFLRKTDATVPPRLVRPVED